MKAAHLLGGAAVILSAAAPACAQTLLAEVVKPGDCHKVSLDMKLTGELKFRKDGEPAPVKLAAEATHVFPERVLAAEAGQVQKVARVYESAKLTVTRGTDKSETTLRDTRKLVVAQRHKDAASTYSPAGALYRAEVDLVSGHFDTLVLPGLLAGKAVKVGETWKVANAVAQSLCGLEGMTENKLEGKLTDVAGDVATFTVTGTAAGVEAGALVKATVEATATFSLKAHKITKVTWKQKSDRDQGPVSPASAIEVAVTLTRAAVEQPAELSDVSLVSVPEGFNPAGPMTNLEFRDGKGRFALLHTRDWHLTAVTENHTVLRLMDRGDYLAQLTVTPWAKAKKGEHLSPEAFKKAMAETTGWRAEKELQADEIKAEGKYVYRLSVQGFLDGVAVLQNFYLVAGPDGEQVVLTFTMSPKAADKIGAKDVSMAASIEVPAGK